MFSPAKMRANPGALITSKEVAWCRQHGAALTVADLGLGNHFLPEDRPDEIAATCADGSTNSPDADDRVVQRSGMRATFAADSEVGSGRWGATGAATSGRSCSLLGQCDLRG
jgi:hypothetical protein